MATYVLVHGAWHSGSSYAQVAEFLRDAGHEVHAPTLAGNRPGDPKTTRLEEAIDSLVDYVTGSGISDVVLVGHSYGGFAITGACDRLPAGTVRRLVYWSAYVPEDGESTVDISPAYVGEGYKIKVQPDGGIPMPYEYWREVLMNDADEEAARRYYGELNPQPYACMTDKIRLSTDPRDMAVGKSFIHCTEDMCYPASAGGWHPRFSERLGLHRFLSMPGGHEVCFTNPELLASRIMDAGRD
jgi:pimeloyl-ACP methyl ester carboxylesterase